MNHRSMRGLFSLTEWVAKFAYINLLWMGFTILGLGVFGLFPATASLFTILRKWIMGESELPVFRTFWHTYRKEFFKANGLGIVVVMLAGLLFVDLYYMDNSGNGLQVTHIPLYMLILAVGMIILYIFPVYVHFDVRFIQLFKNAFLIMLVNPVSNLIMIVGVGSAIFVMSALPGLLFFFGASFTAAIIMAACYLAFQKVEKKQKEAQTL
ncbi:YesL family protein [Bacillus sp. AK031]